MNYINYKQWADHWESLQHQAIDSSLSYEDDDENEDGLDELNGFYSVEDDTKEDDGETAAIFLVVAICLFSFIIAMIISA
jgi:hypothetical protein